MARTPLYKTAESEMISRISSGDWEVGRRLPNEFQLADEFGVSQGTMRRALISLEGMGYLNRKPGRGTLVATDSPVANGAGPAPEPMVVDGRGASIALTVFRARGGTRSASPAEARILGDQRLSYLERTLKHEGNRAAVEMIAVPVALAARLDEGAPVGVKPFLAAHGLAPSRVEASAAAEMTDMSLSVALQVDRHTALLRVTSVARDASGKALGLQVLRLAVDGAMLTHG